MSLHNLDLISIVGVAGIVLATITVLIQQIHAFRQTRMSSEKLEAVEARAANEPNKAKPVWDLARVTLEAYFNRNLSQISFIFWLSVIVMLVGFGIIVWGASQAMQAPAVVVPAAIATFAGLVTEFIGATFLFIYKSTIQQAIGYFHTLERINSVGMAMQILDTLPDEAKKSNLKDITKARMVEGLLAQAYKIPSSEKNSQPKRRHVKASPEEAALQE